jgi:hypothetical protein
MTLQVDTCLSLGNQEFHESSKEKKNNLINYYSVKPYKPSVADQGGGSRGSGSPFRIQKAGNAVSETFSV